MLDTNAIRAVLGFSRDPEAVVRFLTFLTNPRVTDDTTASFLFKTGRNAFIGKVDAVAIKNRDLLFFTSCSSERIQDGPFEMPPWRASQLNITIVFNLSTLDVQEFKHQIYTFGDHGDGALKVSLSDKLLYTFDDRGRIVEMELVTTKTPKTSRDTHAQTS